MGRRGPRPEPRAIKELKGNPGKRRLNDDEPIPPPGEIVPPAWILGSARSVWDQLSPTARAMGVLTSADALTFARYCHAFGEWIDLDHWIRTQAGGVTTFTRVDDQNRILYVGEIPQAHRMRTLQGILLRLEEQFGLTPAARTRIKVDRTVGTAPAAPSAQDEAKRNFFASRGATPPPPPRKIAGA